MSETPAPDYQVDGLDFRHVQLALDDWGKLRDLYGLFQKGRVLAQDGILDADIRGFFDAIDHGWLMKVVEHRTLHPYPEQRLRVMT